MLRVGGLHAWLLRRGQVSLTVTIEKEHSAPGELAAALQHAKVLVVSYVTL